MVDGTIAQGQTSSGTVPIKLCTGLGRELHPSQPGVKFYTSKPIRNLVYIQGISAKVEGIPQTLPSVRSR